MAIFTDNYNLKKPEDTDFFDIADMNGNSDIIDTVLMDFEERISNNTSNEAIEEIEKSVAIHRLGIMGEKSGVYKDVNMLKALANNVNTYEDFYGLQYILDGLIESEEHIGQFLKEICQSEDTSFDTLSTIDDIVSNSSVMDIIISNDKTKKLFYSSKKAMEKVFNFSEIMTTILADTYFYDRLSFNKSFRDIVYNNTDLIENICSNNNFLDYIFDDFNIFKIYCEDYDFFEKLIASDVFIQRLVLNQEYYKYILNDNVLTRYLCENITSCTTFFNSNNIINEVKSNINIILNILKFKNITTAFKNNTAILQLISKNINCLSILTELGGSIDIDFYKNIQNYYSNIMSTINSVATEYTEETGRIIDITNRFRGAGNFFTFRTGSLNGWKFEICIDVNRKYELKAPTEENIECNVVLFGEYRIYNLYTQSTASVRRYSMI